jgi:rubrerythrin
MADLFSRDRLRNEARLRSANRGISDNIQSIAELRQEVETLRKVVRYLIFQQVRGEPLALEEEPIRTWLGLPVEATAEQAMELLMRSQAKVVGTSACPSCGAQLQDLEGIRHEQCPWCGARMDSED